MEFMKSKKKQKQETTENTEVVAVNTPKKPEDKVEDKVEDKAQYVAAMQVGLLLHDLYFEIIELYNQADAKLMHRAMGRMMEGIGSQGRIFDDLRTTYVGNKKVGIFPEGSSGFGVADLSGSTLGQAIVAINAVVGAGAVEAFSTKAGQLGVRNRSTVDFVPSTGIPYDPLHKNTIALNGNAAFNQATGFITGDILTPVTAVAFDFLNRARLSVGLDALDFPPEA